MDTTTCPDCGQHRAANRCWTCESILWAERLTVPPHHHFTYFKALFAALRFQKARAEQAEARVRELGEGLEEIKSLAENYAKEGWTAAKQILVVVDAVIEEMRGEGAALEGGEG